MYVLKIFYFSLFWLIYYFYMASKFNYNISDTGMVICLFIMDLLAVQGFLYLILAIIGSKIAYLIFSRKIG